MGRSKELGPAVKPKSKKEKDETNIMENTRNLYFTRKEKANN